MTKAELDDLQAKFRLLLGPDIRTEIIEERELTPTASGKFRPVESRVGRDILEHMLAARS
jgi:hypothetical protein